jgi:hypothetical protein
MLKKNRRIHENITNGFQKRDLDVSMPPPNGTKFSAQQIDTFNGDLQMRLFYVNFKTIWWILFWDQ